MFIVFNCQCDQYTKGLVSGSLCPKLCGNKKKILLNNCLREEHGQTVSTVRYTHCEYSSLYTLYCVEMFEKINNFKRFSE